MCVCTCARVCVCACVCVCVCVCGEGAQVAPFPVILVSSRECLAVQHGVQGGSDVLHSHDEMGLSDTLQQLLRLLLTQTLKVRCHLHTAQQEGHMAFPSESCRGSSDQSCETKSCGIHTHTDNTCSILLSAASPLVSASICVSPHPRQ